MNCKLPQILRMGIGMIFIFGWNVLYSQQQDSLRLGFEQLNWKDIKNTKNLSVGTKVISGSRSEKEIADLPFTIFIITGEEIRQNGYLTLADALKRLPGIRVSQPGSALEGETFLMRGLPGNAYAKILINDVPIKPFVVSGMPIGAQLPIREAERIEVIYGPAATLYGADASAGVINIILKDSERPFYVQSDLGLGGLGFENLDIMFGGKMGKDKKVLTFKVFGNYTAFDDRRIKYDLDTLYNPNTYKNLLGAQDVSYLNRPNYRGSNGVPLLGNIPHLSNALGLELKYRSWQLSVYRFARRDHSSLGLSPYAVSYANPLNSFGERINTAQLNFNKTINRFRIKASLSALLYQTNDRSSYSYVAPTLNLVLQPYSDGSEAADSLSRAIDDYYFSGQRFSSASSTEINAELLLGYVLNKNIEIAAGFNAQTGYGNPLINFSPDPLDILIDSLNVKRIDAYQVNYTDFSSYLEFYLNFKKWNVILGAQAFTRQDDYLLRDRLVFNPRIALQYRWTERFSLRASTGTSFRYPSPYYSANTYIVDFNNPDSIEIGAGLSPEKTYSAEIGYRWNLGTKVHWDVSTYYSRTTKFINFAIGIEEDFETITLGYYNDDDAIAELYGIQSSISFTNIIPSIGFNSTFNVNYSLGREARNIFSGQENDKILFILGGLRSQPDWIAQIDLEFRPLNKVRLLFENTLMTRSWTRNTILYQISNLADFGQLSNPGFYTLDVMVNYQFNKQLLAYLKINNLFNAEYAGIDATANGNGLIYNPQSKGYIRFGINYRLE